jgi:hypothetical protein
MSCFIAHDQFEELACTNPAQLVQQNGWCDCSGKEEEGEKEEIPPESCCILVFLYIQARAEEFKKCVDTTMVVETQ